MKRTNILTISLLVAIHAIAQTTLNFHPEMFNHLDFSKLTTNILADKAGLSELILNFDGTNNCDTSNLGSWLYSYQTLYVGDTGTPTIPSPDTIFKKVIDNPSGNIPIGALYYSYNYIDDDAINNGLIQLIDTLFYDGTNNGNPYNEGICASIGLLSPDTILRSSTFVTEPIRGNITGNIVSAQIDFGDGNGYILYNGNTQYNITYPASGHYIITLKLNLTNGTTAYAKTGVTALPSVPSRILGIGGFHSDYPCEEFNIVPPEDNSISITRTGSMNDGLVKIWYGKNSDGSAKTTLTNPIIIVDGFDPVPIEKVDRSAEEIYFETNSNKTYKDLCSDLQTDTRLDEIDEGIIDRLRNLGYDIAILDFEWGGNDILENVETTKEAIRAINAELAENGSTEKLIVMGPSMGALISRIALSQMSNHNTRIYISFDGPQQGAYIPMPLQEFYGYMLDIANKTATATEAALFLLNKPISALTASLFQVTLNGVVNKYSPLTCPAAQQMLMYHYLGTSNNQPFAPHSMHTSLYNGISGSYPTDCMNVAISDGDGHGGSQVNFPPAGTDYLGYATNATIKTKIEFKELPQTGSLSDFMNFKVWTNTKLFKWNITLNLLNKQFNSYTTSSSKSYEHEPGGNFDSNSMVAGILSDLNSGFSYNKYECFMPLATAFDLSSGVSNNIFSEFNIPTGRNFTKNIYPAKSPFDMLYVCNENRYHVLRGPNPETGNKSLPGLTKNMTDFIVFLAENSKYCEGESQSNVYDMYDIYYNNGIQNCNIAFNQNFIAKGIVKESYNNSAISLSNVTLTNTDVKIYSTQSITLGTNTEIGNGCTFYASGGGCE